MPQFQKGLAITRTVIIPIGSVEEHGSHLPLGTDTIHAYELAKKTAEIRPVFVAPPIWYGLCRSTSQHPGTLTISGSTLQLLVVEIAKSLYQQGLRNLVIISGHAGGTHMASLLDAGEKILEALSQSRVAVLSVIDLQSNEELQRMIQCKGDAHAGEVETSLMLHLRPSHVEGTSPSEFPAFPKYILVRDKKRHWPGGVWGDPGKASASKGEKLLEKEAHILSQIIDMLESYREETTP